MDTAQLDDLLQELAAADPADAPDLADEAARLLSDELETGSEAPA
ncbi:MAG: hypothetical protein ABIJ75_11960 [Actinomycetota bacterium]|jgi:hypothetical protein